MNFSNIWNHPMTSVAGLLIAITTVTGVLLAQGITLGHLGTGTVVSLIAAIATAFLGLLSKDPGSSAESASNAAQKVGVVVLCMLIYTATLPVMTGCSAATAAANIISWTPALQSAVATVDSTASVLLPADAPIFAAATIGFDAATNLLVAQAKAYLANPSLSVLAQLQNQIVTLQQQVSTALLQAARITDVNSQQHALAAIQGVGTIVVAILSLVQSISTKAQVAQMAADSRIKLAAVEPYLRGDLSAQIVAAHFGEPVQVARAQVRQAELYEMQAGF